jgi:hypothetical protein
MSNIDQIAVPPLRSLGFSPEKSRIMIHAKYPHRHNRDGSFDSICTTCFATVGHATCESDLTNEEAHHSCEQSFLEGRGAQMRMSCPM